MAAFARTLAACAVLSARLATTRAAAPIYGFGVTQGDQFLYAINPSTGERRNIGQPLMKELSAQQLSAVDGKQKVYYLLDFNETTKKPNLLGLSLLSGAVVVDLVVDLPESMFVGVGQYLAADPVSNCVVIAGMDASVKGYRIFEVCPFSGAPGKGIPIATVPAPAVGLLGSSSAIDYNLGLFYATMPLPPSGANATNYDDGWSQSTDGGPTHAARQHWNGTITVQSRTPGRTGSQPPPPPVPKFEIDLLTVYYKGANKGQVRPIKMPEGTNNQMSTCSYDAVKQRVVGFGVAIGPDGHSFKKCLRAAPVPPLATFVTIGEVSGYTGEMGPITTVDSAARLHYSLLMRAPKPWVPSTGCAAAGFPCKGTALCCQFPPSGPACFDVPSCAALTQPNMSAPFDLVPLSLDTAELTNPNPPHMCSIVDGQCPWSLEAAGSIDA